MGLHDGGLKGRVNEPILKWIGNSEPSYYGRREERGLKSDCEKRLQRCAGEQASSRRGFTAGADFIFSSQEATLIG